MIAYLRGPILYQTLDSVILDVNGVGYLVHIPVGTLGKIKTDNQGSISLRIHTSVREDAIQLYGFANDDDKFVFTKLIAISGVGPKLALAVLSDMDLSDIVYAVQNNAIEPFTKVSGVGKKTAQRLLLELKSFVDTLTPNHLPSVVPPQPASGVLDDLRSALQNLGYMPQQIDSVISDLASRDEEIDDIQVLLRHALKLLR